MPAIDKELKRKLKEACDDIFNNHSSDDIANIEYDKGEYVLDAIIEKIVMTLSEEGMLLPYNCDDVYVSFPISQLKEIKKSILQALAPRVTYNLDMEVMKEERDMSRQVSLEKLQRWINRVLQ